MNGQNSNNIMNKFLIFGDSYADEHAPPYPSEMENDEWQNKHSYRWTLKLKEKFEKEYNFKNHAVRGSGPFNALAKLKPYIHNLKKDDIVLFFLSDYDRIDFVVPKEIESHISNIFYSNSTKKSEFFDDPSYINNNMLKAYYLLHEPEIDFFYKNLFNILPRRTLEQLFFGFLKNLSNDKKCKIILFCKNKSLDKSFKNDDFFYRFAKDLSSISDEEWLNLDKELSENDCMIVDERVNHFMPENHMIMFDIICKLLNNEKDIPKFKSNITNFDNKRIVLRGSNDRKFIYE